MFRLFLLKNQSRKKKTLRVYCAPTLIVLVRISPIRTELEEGDWIWFALVVIPIPKGDNCV